MDDTNQEKFKKLITNKSYIEAFEFVKNIADMEVPWAQYELANLFFQGCGVDKNDFMGVFYLGEAGDFGNYAPAKVMLADVFLHGIVVPPNINTSLKYLAEAAAQKYSNSEELFYQRLQLISSSRSVSKDFLSSWVNNTNNINAGIWRQLAINCGLNKNCIKGLAFIYGCKNHFFSNTINDAEIKLNWFMPLPSPDDMTTHFNLIGCDQAIHFIFEEFGYKTGLELDPNRLNIDGKNTNLFKLKNYELLDNFPNLDKYFSNVKDSHHFFENMLEKIGSYLVEDDFYVQSAYLQSCSYINSAFSNDAVAISEIIRVMTSLMPPIFRDLISQEISNEPLQLGEDGGITAFQIAYRGLLDSKFLDMCELLWNCQRFVFYDQSTKELINSEIITLDPINFYNFISTKGLEHINSHRVQNTQAKTFIDQSYLLPNSQISIEDFVWGKIHQISNFRKDDTLTLSSNIQRNACIFKVLFSTLIKNMSWDNKELGEMYALNPNGVLWENPTVENIVEFAMTSAPMISSWSTANQVVVYYSKNQVARINVEDIQENMDDFYKDVTNDILEFQPDELVLFISSDIDIFNKPEVISPNAMKAFFAYYHRSSDPLLTIFICDERNANRLSYQTHIETSPLSESGLSEEFTPNPAVQYFLNLP